MVRPMSEDHEYLIECLEALDAVNHAYKFSNKIRVSIQGGSTGMSPSTEKVVQLYEKLGIHGEITATQEHFIEVGYSIEDVEGAIYG